MGDFVDILRVYSSPSSEKVSSKSLSESSRDVHEMPACPTCLEKAVEKLCALPGVDAEQCQRALELFAEGKISAEGLILLFHDRWGIDPDELMKAFG